MKGIKRQMHNSFVNGMRLKLENYDVDSFIEERKVDCKCKYCTYIDTDKLVQDAFTKIKCRLCGEELIFANSDTDYYCLECAQKNNICKHCGAEMD